MLYRQGFTLMEMIVVLIIIAVAAVFSFPNFFTPTEQANASNAQNNLIAIYTAQRNYFNNNNGNYNVPITAGAAGDPNGVQAVNTALTLNIQDEGTYSYGCSGVTCAATRTSPLGSLTITITLNTPIQLNSN